MIYFVWKKDNAFFASVENPASMTGEVQQIPSWMVSKYDLNFKFNTTLDKVLKVDIKEQFDTLDGSYFG